MSLQGGSVSFVLALVLFSSLTAHAQNNTCEDGEDPDLIIGDIQDRVRYGVVGGITAFAIGNNTCNQGTCQAKWQASVAEHPLFAQNMFRLKNDRFEHIGQSWLKHGFTALQQTLCSSACLPTGSGSSLGVNCSDPYSASLNGSQARLGPKFEVNPRHGGLSVSADRRQHDGRRDLQAPAGPYERPRPGVERRRPVLRGGSGGRPRRRNG